MPTVLPQFCPDPASADSDRIELTPLEQTRLVRETMLAEAAAIKNACEVAAVAAAEAALQISQCRGAVILTGVGKAGLIAQKLVATLASTGTPSHFLHPSEAVHGDLGRVTSEDIVLAFSNSGRSEEVIRVCEYLRVQADRIIAVTANDDNPLARLAHHVVSTGRCEEACYLGLAPTSSTSVMLAVGDAIAMLAARLKGFQASDFSKFHPGGSLGRKLMSVNELMRPLSECRIADESQSLRAAISVAPVKRRCGAVMLTDTSGRLTGIFTDSDLAKLLQAGGDAKLDQPIRTCMTSQPVCVRSGEKIREAAALMSMKHLSELPVVDESERPLGIIDITDLIAAGGMESEPPASQAVLSIAVATKNDS